MTTRGSRFTILRDEVTVRREGASEEENPYWQLEGAPPHPDPSLGCIRRGICCRTSPGWFAPGEVEKAAELRGMTPDAFVRRYLVIDHVEIDGQRVDAFAPVKVGPDLKPVIPPASPTDRLYQSFHGRCVFFGPLPGGDVEGQGIEGCGIYGARPYECRAYDCTNAPEDNPTHEAIGAMWAAKAGE